MANEKGKAETRLQMQLRQGFQADAFPLHAQLLLWSADNGGKTGVNRTEIDRLADLILAGKMREAYDLLAGAHDLPRYDIAMRHLHDRQSPPSWPPLAGIDIDARISRHNEAVN